MPNLRCAIYTRKSSEEGLEQDFNSLDAQREACGAYIQSQRHEGWVAIKGSYDDGGFSGGNMNRPGLVQLLADIDKGLVDVVVVYKVDRLTRSLADFAKIVEAFDKKGISFVSVTQQFNTTTSMGRLTLNVLLSFAQFEREVTGERIRDKVAASKRKGMFMGGNIPVGYDLDNRKLVINEADASFVRSLFERYLALGDATKLKRELDQQKVCTKTRTSRNGNARGGESYTRGMLYYILKNRIYLGEIVHKGQIYPGEHPPIIDPGIFDKVQKLITSNRHDHVTRSRSKERSLLAGFVWDEYGRKLTITHTKKDARRYRYYVSGPAQTGEATDKRPVRIAANDLETIICIEIATFFKDEERLRNTLFSDLAGNRVEPSTLPGMAHWTEAAASVARKLTLPHGGELFAILQAIAPKIVAGRSFVSITIKRKALLSLLDLPIDEVQDGFIELRRDARHKTIGTEPRLIIQQDDLQRPARPQRDPALIKALARAHIWLRRHTGENPIPTDQIAWQDKQDPSYVGKIMRMAFLSPALTEAILDGRQPPGLTIEAILSGIPADWAEQQRKFGRP
ncbi:recombinase family protein [Ferrovibrio sp.]|uniref:recombinase family protein n=1 Tax=Ferrovibrio sp. TaxID=1917215 RepID=UPI003D28E29B